MLVTIVKTKQTPINITSPFTTLLMKSPFGFSLIGAATVGGGVATIAGGVAGESSDTEHHPSIPSVQ